MKIGLLAFPSKRRNASATTAQSGSIDMVLKIRILEFPLGIKRLRESEEVFHTWVERCDVAALHGEYLGPVRTCAKGSELGLDLRQQLHDRVGLELPGEVDRERQALVRHAHP